MTNKERIAICKSCKNHFDDDRYGVMCGVTNNLPHFEDSCRHYSKSAAHSSAEQQVNRRPKKKVQKKKGFSFFWVFFVIWIIYKVVRALSR